MPTSTGLSFLNMSTGSKPFVSSKKCYLHTNLKNQLNLKFILECQHSYYTSDYPWGFVDDMTFSPATHFPRHFFGWALRPATFCPTTLFHNTSSGEYFARRHFVQRQFFPSRIRPARLRVVDAGFLLM